MKTKEVIEQLSEIGFSEYAAKAYLALIQKNPATAYEIAKASGVPTSRIYEVLNKLKERGIILPIEEENGKPRRYIPQKPEEYLAQYQSRVKETMKSLRGAFTDLNGKEEVSYIWNILERDHLIYRARRMILSARKVLLLSLWNEELFLLEEALRAAEKKGIEIALVHFGVPKIEVGLVYYHPIEDTLYAEKEGRGLVVVADRKEVLMGNISEGEKTEGAWSKNRGFAMIAEDYVKHDIYMAKIVRRFDKELIERFGEKYAKLRDVFRDVDNEAGVL